jgi:hypothetical protein
MEAKYYLKNSFDLYYDYSEYEVDKEGNTYTLYYYSNDMYLPLYQVTVDELDGQSVVDYFKEQLY